ncbi:response regulator [Alteromonas lipolytica]|uniref:Response regulatory domain-containing protein n=1 Tax=Alteromonas lipolytica TaxID=1856405 RepID=A0A1E8FH14_9ALTE|nr:response regulator [Alteromonas lipolytica]OFI35204.1 hypothetical protein BFC17_16825 [Alteromonas lipolytica]GGF57599.1 hypothetical protein GCM10011338_07310 [Alteromonas lipolytica]
MNTRVLYLEDNPMNSLVAIEMLDMMEITDVEHHTTLESLMNSLNANPSADYDLIMLDIMLPDGNSTQILPAIKARFSCPILAFTARSQQADIDHFQALGFTDVFLKPMAFDEFERRISAYVKVAS